MELHSVVPLAHVKSVRRSVAFYETLGFSVGNTFTPEGAADPTWAWLESGGAHLMIALADEPIDSAKQGVLFYVYCADVPKYRESLLAAGIDAGPITYSFYAPRGEFRVTDPDGYVLMITHT
jgi:uncharacterized glyoxalase superfamily protein PhnB